jgi:crotonobetainyl-CoA:carnitine CoA-transferase CaiB-like acyl-CoA transferase
MIVGRPAPALGEHGREILAGVGMSAPEVDAIVATAPTR